MLKPVLNPDAVNIVIRLLESTRRTWEADVIKLMRQRIEILDAQVRQLQLQNRERHKCRRCGHQNS